MKSCYLCSIVLINRNGGELLRSVIASLRHSLDEVSDRSSEFEFVLVDNGSEDDSITIVEQAMQGAPFCWHIVVEEEPGVNAARNAGIAASRGRFVVFTDNDLEFSPRWLAAYLDVFREPKGSRVFAGRVLVGRVEGDIPRWLDLTGPYARPSIAVRCDNGEKSFESTLGAPGLDGPVGPNMAFERSVFEEYGRFDTRFGLRPGSLVPGAEAEYFHRIGKRNESFTYVAEACVWHPLKRSQLSKSYFLSRMEGVGRVHSRIQWVDGFSAPRVCGVKRYLIKQLFLASLKWLMSLPVASPRRSFFLRCEVAHLIGEIKEDKANATQSV